VRTYLRVLGHRPLGALLAASLLARLPQSMEGLAVILFVTLGGGSYATAGAAAGGLALGMAAGGPALGRIADRRGPGILVPTSFVHAGLLGLLVVVGVGAPGWLVVAVCAGIGAAFPPTHSVLRGRMPRVLTDSRDLLVPAYALDSVIMDLTFVGGPLLTALLVTVAGAPTALVVAAAATLAGPAVFLRHLPEPAPLPRPAGRSATPLRSPAIVTVMVTMLPFGVAMGALEVLLPAFSQAVGSPDLAGVLLGVWAAGSVLGGLLYGARTWGVPVATRHLHLSVVYPVCFLPLLVPSSPVAMALLVLPAGLLIAPIFASRNELVGAHAPEGSETEALSWPITTLLCGIAAGSAVAGVLIDEYGWRAAVIASIVAASAGAGVVGARRGTLRREVAAR
jgi:MFS family permease